jgi:hypothetical protein
MLIITCVTLLVHALIELSYILNELKKKII